MTLGEMIRYHRRLTGLTQLELADNIGVTDTHISHLENDKALPSIDLLQKMGNEFGV